jgi:nucleoside-diphosphate-sugar epimerase
MQYSRILITGASGFIGSRLCEKFKLQYGLPYRAAVHRFDRAARIARLGSELISFDLRQPAALDAALEGCDAVVHLAFVSAGTAETQLVRAAKRARVKRFIHVSSMAVHGPTPGPECATEATATIGRYNQPYSDAKAGAEKVVQQGIAGGLPGVILRPTIVYGPYSPFVVRVIEAARAGAIDLIDDGNGICNAVYVDDVCDAIHAALHNQNAVGQAMFVNGDRAVSWREYNLTFANMVTPPPEIRTVSSADIRNHWDALKPSLRSNAKALSRLLSSSDFHDQLATVPLMKSTIRWTKVRLKKLLSDNGLAALRRAGGASVGRIPAPAWPDEGRLVREDFHLEFSNALARRVLDWRPAFDLAAGAAATRTWLEFAGMLAPRSY